MVEKVKKIIKKRHFWRTVGFDELSELYVIQFLRSFSSSLIAIFVPIYLYKIGFTITTVFLFYFVWFLVRPLWTYLSARFIGMYGPKHAIALSVVLQICYLSLVMTVQTLHWPLPLIAAVGSLCFGMYLMAFNVDFSKVKHLEHGGRELSYLQMFERGGAIAGPVIGGLIASFIDPRYTMALAIVVLCASLVPIFKTAEPIKKQQLITTKGFPWRRNLRNIMVTMAFNAENQVSITLWPLFLGVFVLLVNTYAVLGILTAISTATAFIVIYIIGKVVDTRHARTLLNIGAIANAALHLTRPFVTSAGQALAVNLSNEPVTAMYRMPFLKGMYGAADDVPGYRIAYFMIQDYFVAVSNIVIWGTLAILSVTIGPKEALQLAFVFGAIMSLLITKQKFAALR